MESIIEELYLKRKEKLKCSKNEKQIISKSILEELEKQEEQIISLFRKIADKESCKKLEDSMFFYSFKKEEETDDSNKYWYKQGFKDAMNMKAELKEDEELEQK